MCLTFPFCNSEDEVVLEEGRKCNAQEMTSLFQEIGLLTSFCAVQISHACDYCLGRAWA